MVSGEPGSVRRRCWILRLSLRRGSGSCGGRRGVGDGADVRGSAAVVRAAVGSAGPASRPPCRRRSGWRSGCVWRTRRTGRPRHGAGGCRRRTPGTRAVPALAGARSPARRDGCPAHGGLCRWGADVEAGTAGVPRCRTLHRGRDSLAIARVPHGDGSWDDSWFVLSARPVQLVRDAGALAVLPLALSLQAGTHIFAGQFVVAEALCGRGARGQRRDREPGRAYARLVLTASRGQRDETIRLTAAGDRDATASVGFRRQPPPVGPTGRSGSRPAPERC